MDVTVLRVCLAPLLVAAATAVQRRWGHAVGGRLTGLPLTSGPILVILLAEHGREFAARTAAGMLLGLLSGCVFCLCYAVVARRRGWPVALGAGLAAFAVCTVALSPVRLPVAGALAVVAVVLPVMLRRWPGGTPGRGTGPAAWWDLPLRMVCTAGMVLAVTAVAGELGPRMAGLLAPLQVIGAVVAVFTHRAQGGPAAAHFLRGVVQGSFSFAAFCAVLAWGLRLWSAAPVLALAAGVAVNVQFLLPRRRE